MTIAFLFAAWNKVVNISNTDIISSICVAAGFAFALAGNYLPKAKRNWLVGIRTPWTLSSEVVWYKAHRFAGKVWVAGGIVIALLCAFVFKGMNALYAILAGLLALAIISVVYSYAVDKNESCKDK